MGLRPNVAYRRLKRPYTRISHRVQAKNFITGIPGSRISQFETGSKVGNYNTIVEMVATEGGNVRHNTLEAVRVVINRHLQPIGVMNYHLRIKAYPHHVLRENPMATGAGADRFQEGMSRAFGKPYGVAARLLSGDTLICVSTFEKYIKAVKNAVTKGNKKVGLRCRITVTKVKAKKAEDIKSEIERLKQQIGEEKKELEKAEVAAETAAAAAPEEGEEGAEEGEKKEGKPAEGKPAEKKEEKGEKKEPKKK